MRPVLSCVLAACAALVLAGCGGSKEDDAVSAAKSWLQSVESGNGAAACKLMDPSAIRGIVKRYVPSTAGKPCPDVVGAYRSFVGPAKLKTILDGGLEYEGKITKQRIGVFPKAKDYEYEVVLMQLGGGDWRVAGSGLGRGRLKTGGG